MDRVLTGLRTQVRAATAAQQPLSIRGGGSKAFYGHPSAGEVLDISAYHGVLAYDPAELVLTARAGTRLGEIEALLAGNAQMLPFEPPRFGDDTIGGCVAAGLSGPRRSSAGAVRDFVLGATLLDGRGELLRFGGQVMKNVAGYDVARLLAGSLGSLGVIVDVSIKLLPQPVMESTLRFEAEQVRALELMNRWAGRPLPISATAWHDGVLQVRLSGAAAAVRKAARELGGEALSADEAAHGWAALRDHHHSLLQGASLWRLALPSTAPPLPLPQPVLIEWNGAQRWLQHDDAAKLRELARAAGGHATAFRGHAEGVPAFDDLPEPVLAIQRRLKQVFDPARIFNRGRLHPEL